MCLGLTALQYAHGISRGSRRFPILDMLAQVWQNGCNITVLTWPHAFRALDKDEVR